METWGIILGLVYVIVEYFLGETKVVKPNSTLAAVLGVGKKVINIVKEVFAKKKE